MRKFLNSLNLWRRLGVVATVIWLAVVPPLFWYSEHDSLDYNASRLLESCLEGVAGLPKDADLLRSNVRSMKAQGASNEEVETYLAYKGVSFESLSSALSERQDCLIAANRNAALNPGTSYPVMFGWCALFAAAVWALMLSASFATRWVWAGRTVVPESLPRAPHPYKGNFPT